MARREHETIALSMCLVVLCDCQIEGLRAPISAALADDLDPIVPTIPRLFTRLFDFAIHRTKHGLVSRNTLVTCVHVHQMPHPRKVYTSRSEGPASRMPRAECGHMLRHQMLGRLRKLRERLRFGSFERGDSTSAPERPVENLDGMTAGHSGREIDTGGEGGGIPPGYVKSYDEGRPRH